MIDLATARTALTDEMGRSDAILSDADWSRPTRLAGWSIGDLARHLVGGRRMQTAAWRTLAGGPATDDGEVGDEDDAVREALASSAAALLDTLARTRDEQLGELLTMPYGTMPAAFVLLLAVMEAGTHASDLAAAVGRSDTLSAVVTDAAVGAIAPSLPLLAASGEGAPAEPVTIVLAGEGAFEIAVSGGGSEGWALLETTPARPTTTIAGSASDVVLFALGRRAASDLRVDGDLNGAERFKAWFPGP
jgi:uncharacterized protein (TIGR03083 family)